MKKESALIILGTAHLGSTPGKCSPDGRLKEAVWSREICKEICVKLRGIGYNAEIDYEPLNASGSMKGASAEIERNHELAARVNIVNNYCKKYGKTNCLYVSVHVNAAGSDNKWHTAGGFSVYTSKGMTLSDILAENIYDRAFVNLTDYDLVMYKGKKSGAYDSKQRAFRMDTTDGDKDLESDFYVLKNTYCPAVLVECMFQDNKSDVDYLLSDAGKHSIMRTLIEGIIDYINKA